MSKKNDEKNNSASAKVFIGYKPFAWQKAVHNGITKYGKGSGTIHMVKAKRQIGKSYIIINELLRFAINYKNTVNVCLSPTLNQGRKIYKTILKAIENSGILKGKNDSLLEITLVNDSTILFKSAEQKDALRGFTVSGILCIDEAAYISDEVYSIIQPTTDVHRCPILIVSTPRFKTGFFWQKYALGCLKSSQPQIISYDLCQYDTSQLLSPERLEMYRQTMPKNMFKSEYLGEFLDSDSMLFGEFKSCVMKAGEKPVNDEWYVGIDFSGQLGQDDTAMSILNSKGEQIHLEYFNNMGITLMIEKFANFFNNNKNKIKAIYIEKNSIGNPLIEMLKQKLNKGIHITEWVTTNSSKASLVSQLQVAFEQKKIRIMNDEKQEIELASYEATLNQKTGNVSYNAPAGMNDDICIALMLSWEAFSSKNKKGKYCLG